MPYEIKQSVYELKNNCGCMRRMISNKILLKYKLITYVAKKMGTNRGKMRKIHSRK